MVSEVKAYRASDGTLFSDKLSAARHDAKIQLMKLIGNEGFVNTLMGDPHSIVTALYPLCELIPKIEAAERQKLDISD